MSATIRRHLFCTLRYVYAHDRDEVATRSRQLHVTSRQLTSEDEK